MATHIDPEKEGKYPIVLSDALMGRGTKELITGIRYNHKPTESSASSLKDARLKSTSSSGSDTYDLSFVDGLGKYQYQGTRTAQDGQYVLIFDPVKKHFVLHQVDSSFDMNLTSVPWPHEAGSLRDTYEQLQSTTKSRRKSSSAQRTRVTKVSAAKEHIEDVKRRKVEKPKKKPPPREPTPDAEDEESDDGFTIEYPGGPPPSRFGIRSSPVTLPVPMNPVSEESDADADFEEDDETNNDVDMLQLPSPVANAAGDDEDDLELDLEAELEQALEKDESSESEEE